jgi:hypothetical protein
VAERLFLSKILPVARLVNIAKVEAVLLNQTQKIFIVNVPSNPVMQLVAGLIIVTDRELVVIKHLVMAAVHQLVMVVLEHQANLVYIIMIGENIQVVQELAQDVRQERVRILQVAVKTLMGLILVLQHIIGAMVLLVARHRLQTHVRYPVLGSSPAI